MDFSDAMPMKAQSLARMMPRSARPDRHPMMILSGPWRHGPNRRIARLRQ
jgi:hypothetical protein